MLCGLSLVAVSRGDYISVRGFFTAVASLVVELGQALGRVASVVTAPGPLEHRLCNWRVGLVDLRHVGSS